MKKQIKLVLFLVFALMLLIPTTKVYADTALEEIVITGDIETESLEPGELPEYEVQTTTEHVSIEAYGSNTNWAQFKQSYDSWRGFGSETPTAVDDHETFYAMRLKVDLDEGYVFDENTKVIYNDRDMYDTYTVIDAFDWGGYVYVDLGQVRGEPGPDVEGNVIRRININVEMPRIGQEITVNESTQTQYGIRIDDENIEIYGPNGDETHNYMYIYDPNKEGLFSGVLEKQLYRMVIWLTAFDDYIFAENLEIYVNGEYVDDYFAEDEKTLGIDYEFEPVAEDVPYSVATEDDEFIAEFEFPEGIDFELDVFDLLKYTPEEIEEMFDVPAEYYEEALEAIKNNTKEYGDLLGVYAIEINGPGFNYSEGLTFKIKMTEAMKKYNTFKFIFLDENNEFVVQEIHDAKIEGDYLVFELDHLSAYALVGSYVEDTANPKTADNIVIYVAMLGLCVLGLVGAGIYTKKKYFNK